MKKLFVMMTTLVMAASLAGCVAVHSSNVSDQGSATGKTVEATVEGNGILHLTAPELSGNTKLSEQCSGSSVKNVQSTLSMRDVLGFVQMYSLKLKGQCEK